MFEKYKNKRLLNNLKKQIKKTDLETANISHLIAIMRYYRLKTSLNTSLDELENPTDYKTKIATAALYYYENYKTCIYNYFDKLGGQVDKYKDLPREKVLKLFEKEKQDNFDTFISLTFSFFVGESLND